MKHSYTRFARPYKPDSESIKTGKRTTDARWEFGLIRYDSAAYGSNPDDTKSEHQEYLAYGLAADHETALAEMNLIEMPADAKPSHHESRAVGVPGAAWSIGGNGATPAARGNG